MRKTKLKRPGLQRKKRSNQNNKSNKATKSHNHDINNFKPDRCADYREAMEAFKEYKQSSSFSREED